MRFQAGWVALWGTPCSWPRSALRKANGQPYRPVRGLRTRGGPSVSRRRMGETSRRREMGRPHRCMSTLTARQSGLSSAANEPARCRSRAAAARIDCMLPDGKLNPHDTIYKFDAKGKVVRASARRCPSAARLAHRSRGQRWATDAAAKTRSRLQRRPASRPDMCCAKFSPADSC